jgi:hypothetical protein
MGMLVRFPFTDRGDFILGMNRSYSHKPKTDQGQLGLYLTPPILVVLSESSDEEKTVGPVLFSSLVP